MVEIPDKLACLFSASIDREDGSYRIKVPRGELEQGSVAAGETYRVALLPSTTRGDQAEDRQPATAASDSVDSEVQTPPVETGETREVTIETTGDQGDGIVKVERGYVVIVPGARPDDEVTIEIENVRQNVAFARVVDEPTDGQERTEGKQPDETGFIE